MRILLKGEDADYLEQLARELKEEGVIVGRVYPGDVVRWLIIQERKRREQPAHQTTPVITQPSEPTSQAFDDLSFDL